MSSVEINANPVGIVLWVAIIAVVLIVFFGGRMKKGKYKGQVIEITKDWYEQSQSRYSTKGGEKKAYYFRYDNVFLTPGHVMENRNHETVYEAKILYGDVIKGYETDFTNHVINYRHHHNIGAVSTSTSGGGEIGTVLYSYFKFDGTDIWDYLESLGYSHHFTRCGLAYRIDVSKGGWNVGTIYSSNNGKNYFGCEGPIEPKPGNKGFSVVECADTDLDAMFLMAMAFARTELSADNLR